MSVHSSETLIVASPNVTSCEVSGEAVILDAASGRYFALDPVGSALWQHLQTPCTVASLCQKLLDEYDVTAERCHAGVATLLDQLAAQGLIRVE